LAAALAGQGYQLLVAKDGAEAVAAASLHQGPIHLFLTDMTMPGMSGIDAAVRIAAARPGLRVLVVSGYLADRALPTHDLGFMVDSVSKPVSPSELTRKVRAMLDQAR
jgi:CheY-like chemotaxis protein